MRGIAKLRCAIYTRKSTEEGLEQEFNSLDAQREACEAYVSSQSSLGWKLVPDHYDDGGISGGTMERPALRRLLQDIRDRKVDVVVVYKIDRLTRSLMDFSKIVEVFDGHGVSFVSVTQQFNTTTSMGRLTLNVLLSFAQFEREVAAERVRDKVAASKKKGMWMGGSIPTGYRIENKKLIPEPGAADIVRAVFERYLRARSVPALARELQNASGRDRLPGKWTKSKLYYMLSNPIYVGRVRHGKLIYEGEHQGIVDQAIFDRSQALLKDHTPARAAGTNVSGNHLLGGILFDGDGNRLSPVFTSGNGRRYRYYVDANQEGAARQSAMRLPADRLEQAVIVGFSDFLMSGSEVARLLQDLNLKPDRIAQTVDAARVLSVELLERASQARIKRLLNRVTIAERQITLSIHVERLADYLLGDDVDRDDATLAAASANPGKSYEIAFGMSIRRRGVEARIVVEGPSAGSRDRLLVDLIARAHYLLRRLTDGTALTMAALARDTGIHIADISRILPLAFLSPKMTDAILSGQQPAELTARLLSRADVPMQWDRQPAALSAE